jgi:uncharacterized cofD-like protein
MSRAMPESTPHRPHIVMISGGSACRSINMALCRHPVDLTRIVPAWDSGGSSRVIRERFGILPVGDIRQALMTMAHGEGRAGEVVKICNTRLSDVAGGSDCAAELDLYVSGRHPLLSDLEPGLGGAILSYLRLFRERMGADFDLARGSIGNFILAGAYLAHGRDINTAIIAFRKLCGIAGHVWPVSTGNDVRLAAELKDGRLIEGQHNITKLKRAERAVGIASVRVTAGSEEDRPVAANPAALDAITAADAIVLGPGSFYTSVLPHLMVAPVRDAILANRRAPRVLVGNIQECAETTGHTVAAFVETLAAVAGAPLVTDVVANRDLLPFRKSLGGFRYLATGDLAGLARRTGLAVHEADLEDAWTRGTHDGPAVAAIIDRLARAGAGSRTSQGGAQ